MRNDGICACGCGKELSGKKRRWASKDCQETAVINYFVVKGDLSIIRAMLFDRDKGYCYGCGVYSEDWQADHILPVYLGGSACGLENMQTLCKDCHKQKTYTDSHIDAISLHASCIFDLRNKTDFGAISCVFPKQSIETDNLESGLVCLSSTK